MSEVYIFIPPTAFNSGRCLEDELWTPPEGGGDSTATYQEFQAIRVQSPDGQNHRYVFGSPDDYKDKPLPQEGRIEGTIFIKVTTLLNPSGKAYGEPDVWYTKVGVGSCIGPNLITEEERDSIPCIVLHPTKIEGKPSPASEAPQIKPQINPGNTGR